METVTLADAQTRLEELLDLVDSGTAVEIVRANKPPVRLSPSGQKKQRIDIEMLRAVTDGMKMQSEDAGTFMRRLRDDARY